MVLKIMMVVGIFMLTACVTKRPESVIGTVSEDVKLETVAEQKEVVEPKKTAIDSDVLFLLMTAEIAGQRGQYGLALDGYLRAAKRVGDVEVIKRAAKIALYLQDENRLRQSLDLWREADADSLEMRHFMAVTALKSGNRQEAFDSLEFILREEAEEFDGQVIAIIKNLREQTELDLAYQVLADLSDKYPENAKLYFMQALLSMQLQKNTQAQIKIAKALVLEPNWVKALLLQAQLYIAQGDLTKAVDFLKRAVAEEDNAKIKEQIAQLLIQQERFEEAREVLSHLIDADSKNNELKFKLSLVYLQIGKEKEARVILEALVSEKSFRDQAAFYLGRIDAKAKSYNEALIWFDAVRERPYRYEANVSAVLILMDQKRYESALVRLKRLKVEFSEKLSELVLIESEVYSQIDAYQQGFDVLTEALLKDAENKKILYARALMAEKLGKLQVLEDDLKYILEKDPNDANVLNALGYTLADKTTRYAEAQSYLDRAIAIKPNEPVIMDSYGWLLFKLNKLEQARVYLQRAYDAEPQAEIAAHLVDVLWALGEQKQAKAILSDVLKKMPNDSLLLEVKMRLLGNNE